MTTPLAQAHGYAVGDLVQTWYADTGSATPGYVYGIVTFAGPKRVGVVWENGRRNSLHRDRWHLIERVPDPMRDVALDATKVQRTMLLTRINKKQEAELERRGELRTFALMPDGSVRRVKP